MCLVEDCELADVAAVSAMDNNEVGNMIAEALKKVEKKGVVALEKGKSADNSLRLNVNFMDIHIAIYLSLFVQLSVMPIRSVIGAAKAIVNGACRGDSYLTEPGYIRTTFYWKVFCPEVLEIMNRWLLISGSSERGAISKKLLDLTGLKNYLYPESIRNPKLKPN
ncbi:hypothetical protein RIF29_08349 [Crotalaria pallida]|uniref:Uncharacterized protein n=1 Tax=Crotalaria pallida TaxID=3830 RepID=A0AAN9FTE2_CROPI